MMPFDALSLEDAVRLRIGAGARESEAQLLHDVEMLLRDAGHATQLLAQPLRVVVPSQSLRLHVAAALVRSCGRSVVGVSVQTLYGVAVEIIDRAGEPIPRGDALFPLLVRQQARQEAVLRAALDDLVDGYAAVGGTVSDLLDAGFMEVHAEVLDELLAQHPGGRGAVARARALVRVSARVGAALTRYGLGRSTTLLQRAREIVERQPMVALPARAVLVHGFADATGVATDFIEVLLRRCGGRVYVDHPPDPAGVERTDIGSAFTRRFVERLGPPRADSPRPVAAPQLWMLGAPGAQAEARAVARRIRGVIDQGVRPEAIAVVARDLGAYVIPLRLQLGRLGIPFSGIGARGPITAAGRRVHGLLDLLARKADVTADRWLDVLDPSRLTATSSPVPPALCADIRLALRAHGAARLRDVASVDVPGLLAGRSDLPLPVRRGLSAPDDDVDALRGTPRASRRRLRADVLAHAVGAARALVARLARWSPATDLRAHVAYVCELLTTDLGWSPQSPAAPVFAALEALARELPPDGVPDLVLSPDEITTLLRRAFGDIGTPALGGEGGGVQVLNVVEARARTWEHLFVIGMNRDVFPRTVREDPLLPDTLRRALAHVLPDIPIKQIGFDEERYLFAQLLSASPRVTLSWQSVDDEGKLQAASPLIERLRLAYPNASIEWSPARGVQPSDGDVLMTPHEHAVQAGLHGARAHLREIWRVAIADTQPVVDPRVLADARIAILEEQDPDRRRAQHLGPYFGFIGAPREAADLRRNPLYVTVVERMAGCPWQTFVRRLLQIEPPPDPLTDLPSIDALLLGNTVHHALEQLISEAGAPTATELATILSHAPAQVVWPDATKQERLLHAAAAEVLRQAGIGLPGLAAVLATQARPYLEAARNLDWPAQGLSVLGAEIEGALTLRDGGGRQRTIRFRADRVDASNDTLRLTDYKTGAPVSDAKTAKTRHAHFLGKVATGALLQAVSYALGARALGAADVAGRYAFVKPDLDAAARSVEVRADDADVITAFERVVRTVLQAWDAGSFFPRLAEPRKDVEPRRCEFCEVAPACLRRDSGARARLRAWTGRAPGADVAERALLALWNLGEDVDATAADEEA